MIEMKALREKEDKELRKVLAETRAEITQLRGKRAIGSLADTSLILKKRREVAKILTVLGEKEILKEVSQVTERQNGRPKKRPSISRHSAGALQRQNGRLEKQPSILKK